MHFNSDEDPIDPPRDVNVDLKPAGNKFEAHVTWGLAPHSKWIFSRNSDLTEL